MTDFTAILSSDYQNFDYFKDEVLMKIFGNFDDSTAEEDYIRDNDSLREAADAAYIKAIRKTGNIEILGSPLEVFEIIINSKSKISRSRIGIQNVVRRQLQTMGNAFMVFRYENPENRSWRFSFLQKGSSQKDSTTAKRYTYVFGREYNPRTANERFNKLSGKVDENGDSLVGDADLEEAFSVEALSDEFFAKYKCIYANFVQYITGKRVVKTSKGWAEKIMHQPEEILYDAFNHDDKRIRDYVKKLLGRIIFLYFVQKKGWFNNDLNYLQHLFESTKYQDDFLDRVLEPFFYTVLNTEPKNRESAFDTHNQNLKLSEVEWDKDLLKQWKDFPFLNGGLFERDENDIVRSKFPPQFFENNNGYDENFVGKIPTNGTEYTWEKIPGIFDLFAQYNFTIDENDPEDAEVGIDPEMLGQIFENLLEDNKDKGAFYTPKEIVQYMCRRSLILYLQDHTDKRLHPAIDNLINGRHVDLDIQPKAIARDIYSLLENIKVCDPAIGSGVFPMGMLSELYNARLLMYGFTAPKKDFVHFDVKKSIIENNIYGVDIEQGAIDIARLRFWLALAIEEKDPTPLPNFDYKFMQGNSLLERYEEVDLNGLTKQKTENGEGYQITIFDDNLDVFRRELNNLVTEYFNTTDHIKKQKMREQIVLNVQRQLVEQKIDKDFSSIKLHANSVFFLWHTWFAAIFANGGFDIVIGNPPYFNIQTLGAHSPYAESVMNTYSDIWQDKSDILFYFFRLALDLSNDVICFITSNAYLFSDKAKKLRNKMLESGRLKSIVNFEEYMVFNSASITTCITTFTKTNGNISAVNLKGKNHSKKEIIDYIEDKTNSFSVNFKKDSVFALVDSSIANLNEKIDGNYKQLRDLFKIGKGMETAANGVFCFSEYPKQFPAKYIKRRMCGEIIEKYIHSDKEEYMLYLEDEQNYDDLPKNVKMYLNNNKQVLSERAQIKRCKTSVWWKYTFAMHKDYYNLNKIWCSYRSKTNIFALDETSDYIGLTNTTVIFDTNKDLDLKFLLALLNSKVLTFRYKSIGKQTGSGVYEYFENGVGKLPIPFATKEQQYPIINLVDCIIATKEADSSADTSEWESEIDFLVYKLYGLNYDEVLAIDPKTEFSREKYETN